LWILFSICRMGPFLVVLFRLLVVVGCSFLPLVVCCCIPLVLGPNGLVPYIQGIRRVWSNLRLVLLCGLRCIRLGPGIFGMVRRIRDLRTRNTGALFLLHSLVGFLVGPIGFLFLFSFDALFFSLVLEVFQVVMILDLCRGVCQLGVKKPQGGVCPGAVFWPVC